MQAWHTTPGLAMSLPRNFRLRLVQGWLTTPNPAMSFSGFIIFGLHLTPVWLTTSAGCRLPVEYVDAIGGHVIDADASWDLDVDDLPLDLITHVASADGVSADVVGSLRSDCPFAPELLRFSPF